MSATKQVSRIERECCRSIAFAYANMRTTYWRDLREQAGSPATGMEWRQRWLTSFRYFWATMAVNRPVKKYPY